MRYASNVEIATWNIEWLCWLSDDDRAMQTYIWQLQRASGNVSLLPEQTNTPTEADENDIEMQEPENNCSK